MKDRDFSNPNTKFVAVTPEMERSERSSGPQGSSLMASWNSSADELDPSLVPADKLKLLRESQEKQRLRDQNAVRPSIQPMVMKPQGSEGAVTIPVQAFKKFKLYLDKADEVRVIFTAEGATALLQELSSMKTPTVMSDAKAIIRLSEQLERIIGA